MPYDISTHTHIYSSWAASRASSVINNRFSVEKGQSILSKSKIKSFIHNPGKLPNNASFDREHMVWREELITISDSILDKPFTHGMAAKMINIYLKTIIICGGYHDHMKAAAVHPPIDSVLLKGLAKQDFNSRAKFWRKANRIAWSNFTSDDYQNVIDEVREGLNGKALWRIEEYWKGHQ